MKPTKEEIAARLDAEAKRQKESKIVSTWKPTLTEQEQKERQQQIEAGILPF